MGKSVKKEPYLYIGGSQYRNPEESKWDHPDKQNNRELISEVSQYCLSEEENISILSLPAAYWIFEKTICKYFSDRHLHCKGLESHPKVFDSARRSSLRLNQTRPQHDFQMATLRPATAKEYLHINPSAQYDLIYLDWMGTWSQGKKDETILIFKNELLSKKALLAFTIDSSRGQPKSNNELVKYMSDKRIKMNFDFESIAPGVSMSKKLGLAKLIKSIAESYQYELRPRAFHPYKSESKTPPQLTFIFEVGRKRRS